MFCADGVPTKRSTFWADVKRDFELPASVTPESIYTAMLLKYRTEHPAKEESIPNEINSSIEGNENEKEKEKENVSSELKPKPIKFSIHLSLQIWNRIRPEKMFYQDSKTKKQHRQYRVLKPGAWTGVIAQQIARQQKDIQCKWTFKRGKVYENGKHYIEIQAHCVTCKAELSGYLTNKPESPVKIIRVQFEVRNMNLNIHAETKQQRTVRVNGDFAQQIYANDQPACVTRRNMLRKAAGMFENPVDRILSAASIRSGKYRLRQLELLHDCPITSLNILKLEVFPNHIQNIGLNPFHVMYGSPDQVTMYKICKRKNKIISVSCDATGGVADKIGK